MKETKQAFIIDSYSELNDVKKRIMESQKVAIKNLAVAIKNPGTVVKNHGAAISTHDTLVVNDKRPLKIKDLDKTFGVAALRQIINIEFCEDNQAFSSIDGLIYSKDKTKLLYCPRSRTGKIVIPEGVEEVYRYAFTGSHIEEVTFPDSLKIVKSSAFEYCPFLKKVSGGDGIIRFEPSAFMHCENLSDFYFGKSLEGIGDFAFDECRLTEVIFPYGLQRIGTCTFRACEITKVALPETVKLIKEYAFSCTSTIHLKKYNKSVLWSLITPYYNQNSYQDLDLAPCAILKIDDLPEIAIPRFVNIDKMNDLDLQIKRYMRAPTESNARLFKYGITDYCQEYTAMEHCKRFKSISGKRFLAKMAEDILHNVAEDGEEAIVDMLKEEIWTDMALKRMLAAAQKSNMQVASSYILNKIKKSRPSLTL